MKVGEIIIQEGDIEINAGRACREILVANKGDRPIQVGSHYHFFEVNRALDFNRKEAYGYRLEIPSGTSVRFEPGEEKVVTLVQLGGAQRVFGLNDLTCNQVSDHTLEAAVEVSRTKGFVK